MKRIFLFCVSDSQRYSLLKWLNLPVAACARVHRVYTDCEERLRWKRAFSLSQKVFLWIQTDEKSATCRIFLQQLCDLACSRAVASLFLVTFGVWQGTAAWGGGSGEMHGLHVTGQRFWLQSLQSQQPLLLSRLLCVVPGKGFVYFQRSGASS